MIQTPADAVFFGIAGVILAITAFKPQWTTYVLTYGRPERIQGWERSVVFMRICAAVAAAGLAIEIVYWLIIGLGVEFSVGL